MSQIMDSLNKLEQAQSEKSTKKARGKAKPWLGRASVVAVFILIIGLNVNILLTMGKLSKRIDSIILAVVKFQNPVKGNTEQIASLSEDLETTGAGVKDLKGEVSGLGMKVSGLEVASKQVDKLSGRISKLEEDRDITKFSLRTLAKAKNELFKKVGDLRVGIQELKDMSEVSK